MVIKDIVAAP